MVTAVADAVGAAEVVADAAGAAVEKAGESAVTPRAHAVRYEEIAELPKFDTGLYEGCTFSMSGGDAKLILRFTELPPFEINFHRARWHQFTALPNCDAEQIKSAYFRLVEVMESRVLSSFVDGDRAPIKAYKELHHYRIFLDETGCHEVFAESASAGTSIDALSLDDTRRWADLRHAYGSASDIPGLLRQLAELPASSGKDEPWFSLWSALAHQGDVYPASFAAVPHVVRALSIAPAMADSSFFHFPAWVEICRQKTATPIPDDLRHAYFAALQRLPSLVAAAANREWDGSFLACILSTVAAAKGYGTVAEAAQELTPDVASEFLEWFFER
ncbi:hypothetical protein [Bradyrhizobium iriomotense]|uniref:Uncharacterized protein n=1 Tax=Bradyrhizobium iriomotense TaxID=441950 RepID=A0ABQ6B6M7_9BRAD|nr:hypothetical protein [Bradyrhizobium iriomotense]GLR89131.1 hypothetical protein GCM10007857_58440 [Bradyrhizobium iriomotense]